MTSELPELPEPGYPDMGWGAHYYTADQMLAFRAEGIAAAIAAQPTRLTGEEREALERMDGCGSNDLVAYSAADRRLVCTALRRLTAPVPLAATVDEGELIEAALVDSSDAWTDADAQKPWGCEIAFLRHLANDPAIGVEKGAMLRHCAKRIESTAALTPQTVVS